MWGIHYLEETIISGANLNDPDIRAAYEGDPGVLEITSHDPTMPDLDMEREARYLAGLHLEN